MAIRDRTGYACQGQGLFDERHLAIELERDLLNPRQGIDQHVSCELTAGRRFGKKGLGTAAQLYKIQIQIDMHHRAAVPGQLDHLAGQLLMEKLKIISCDCHCKKL